MSPESLLPENEAIVRLSIFIGVLFLLLLLEYSLPRKQRALPRQGRWFANFSLVLIDMVAVRVLIPVAAVSMALIVEDRGWGIFGLLKLNPWIEFVLSVLLLDMLIYWQHVITHHIPVLWAVHRVHHSDRDFDVTTGIRFHPIEIVLSVIYKIVCVVAIGPAVAAVFVFEVWLNAAAMFSHTDIKLPRKFDRLLRRIIVTPDMHRVHHSIIGREINSNYGFGLSVWDKVFGTYIDQPADGHDDMVIGLANEQTENPSSLRWCLIWPLHWLTRNKPG